MAGIPRDRDSGWDEPSRLLQVGCSLPLHMAAFQLHIDVTDFQSGHFAKLLERPAMARVSLQGPVHS
jgi:hypothetical protein